MCKQGPLLPQPEEHLCRPMLSPLTQPTSQALGIFKGCKQCMVSYWSHFHHHCGCGCRCGCRCCLSCSRCCYHSYFIFRLLNAVTASNIIGGMTILLLLLLPLLLLFSDLDHDDHSYGGSRLLLRCRRCRQLRAKKGSAQFRRQRLCALEAKGFKV